MQMLCMENPPGRPRRPGCFSGCLPLIAEASLGKPANLNCEFRIQYKFTNGVDARSFGAIGKLLAHALIQDFPSGEGIPKMMP